MSQQTTLISQENERRNIHCERDNLLEDTLAISINKPDFGLTKREGEILRLVVAGQTNKQIARQLSRSERTIEYHRNRLMRKMAVHNAAELVKQAIITGAV